jgi:excisionase family DNA binding protein
MAILKTQEVAILLNKSGETVRRYVAEGLLHPARNGRDLLFDRDEVIAFAEKRGIHVKPESGVPQGRNFYQAFMEALQKAPAGASLTYTKPSVVAKA